MSRIIHRGCGARPSRLTTPSALANGPCGEARVGARRRLNAASCAAHCRSLWLACATVLACGLLVPSVAGASGPQVTVMYPVGGTLTSSPLENPPHHHYWGNFAVDD